jgi:hypothetical protein
MSVNAELGRLRQEECHSGSHSNFKANLGYITRYCFQKQIKKHRVCIGHTYLLLNAPLLLNHSDILQQQM